MSTWKTIATGGPGPRSWNQTTYDTKNAKPIVGCGSIGSGGYRNDVWALEAGAWVQKVGHIENGLPAQREHQGFVYCPVDGKTYLFNGHPSGTQPWSKKRVIYRFDTAWEETSGLSLPPGDTNSDSGWPPMRMSAACDWCPPLDGFLIAGGANWQTDRTYLLRRGDLVMERLTTVGSFVGTGGIRFNVNNQGKWVEEIGRFAFFGGHPTTTGGAPNNRLSMFDPSTKTWYDQPTKNQPPGRAEGALIVRPGYLAVFAGVGGSGFDRLIDAWELDLHTWEWTRLPNPPHDYWFHGGWWHENQYILGAGYSSTAANGPTIAIAPDTVEPPTDVVIHVPQTLVLASV